MKFLKLLLSLILVFVFSLFSYVPIHAYESPNLTFRNFQVISEDEVESPADLADSLHRDGLDLKTYAKESTKFTKYDRNLKKNIEVNEAEVTSYVIKKTENNTKSGTKSIVSAAAVIHQTITYSTYTNSGGHTYGKLTKSSGKVTDLNSGFKFVKATIELHSMGLGVLNQKVTKQTSSATWSFNAPTNWVYSLMDNDWSAIGSNVTVSITRNGSKIYNGTYNLQVN